MTNFLSIIFILLLTSCSQVNTESQNHFKEKNELKSTSASISIKKIDFRHGLIPIPFSEIPKQRKVEELDSQSVARGKIVYSNNCINCHGVNADGNGPESTKLVVKPKSLVNIAKNVPNFKLYMMVSQWKGEMPGWKSMLNEKETNDLKSYILSLVKE